MAWRHSFLGAFFAATIGLTIHGSAGAETTESAAPRHENTNVILISLQCLRPDHLGAYGYKRQTSPNMDSFATQSVLFENAIAQANLTPVAQMSVLTSQYPRVNGMVSFEVPKEMVSRRTLPEILKYYGYTTAATISSPEFFMRFDTEAGNVVSPGDIFSRSFDYYGRSLRGAKGSSIRILPSDSLDWISRNKDKKFFLWIGSGLLHMPYAAAVPKQYQTMFDPPKYTPFWKKLDAPAAANQPADPSYETFSRVLAGDYYLGFKTAHHLQPDDIAYVNGRYDAGVYYTDLLIGAILKELDELKLTEKTMVIIQSIHGEDLGENGNFFHYDVTDTVVKNALIIRFPKGEFAGRRISQQVQGLDIMPTVLDYLDIPINHEAQGTSMLPLIKGDKNAPTATYAFIDRMPWWEYTLSKWYLEHQSENGVHYLTTEEPKLKDYAKRLQKEFDGLDYPPGDVAIRTNEWKLVVRKNPELLAKISWWAFITGRPQPVPAVELFDLKNDPLERKNVAADHPDVVADLKKRLLEWDGAMERQKAQYKKEDKRWLIPYP